MQLSLDFEPGLTERHKTLLACIRECAYKCSKPLKVIAADMDLSESDLSRKLSGNPDDPRRFTVDDLVRFVEVTGDTMPVNWLIERFHLDDDAKVKFAATAFLKQLPQMVALAKSMGAKL
jgi:hypothetical protein